MSDSYRATAWWRELMYATRYAGSGLINTLVGFIVIFTAMALGATPLLANCAGYAVGFFLGFVLSKKFVFRANGHFVSESLRYLLAFAAAFLANLAILRVALDVFSINPYLAQFGAAASYTILMYLLTRYFVFRPNGGGGRNSS
jgi:putative flippase GtrA